MNLLIILSDAIENY